MIERFSLPNQPIENKEKLFSVEKLEEVSDKVLKEILKIEEDSFPKQMRLDEESFKELLTDKESINYIVRDNKGNAFSYLIALPLFKEYQWLKEHDRDILPERETIYLESVAIRPDIKPERVFPDLFGTLVKEAMEKNYKKISLHARISNNFSQKVQKYCQAKLLRHFDNWCNYGEPFDYLEIDFSENKPKKE